MCKTSGHSLYERQFCGKLKLISMESKEGNMRILVFSDSHGAAESCIHVAESVKDVDMILHAGDTDDDAERLATRLRDIPVWYVAGNNDFFTNAPEDRLITIGGFRIALTHGHRYRVKWGLKELAAFGKKEAADLVVFGHTHESFDGYEQGVHLLNPGNMCYGRRSYAVIEIEAGKLRTAIVPYCG